MNFKNLTLLNFLFFIVPLFPVTIIQQDWEKVPFSPDDLGTIVLPRIDVNIDGAFYQFIKDDFTVNLVKQKGGVNLWQFLDKKPIINNLATNNKIVFSPTDPDILPKVTLTKAQSNLGNEIILQNTGSLLNSTYILNFKALLNHLPFRYELKTATDQEVNFQKFEPGKKYMKYAMGGKYEGVACAIYLVFTTVGASIYAIVFTTRDPNFATTGAYRKNWIFTKSSLDKLNPGILTVSYQ